MGEYDRAQLSILATSCFTSYQKNVRKKKDISFPILYLDRSLKVITKFYIYTENQTTHHPSSDNYRYHLKDFSLSYRQTKKKFGESESIYQEALKKPGCNHQLKFQENTPRNQVSIQ